MYFIQGNQSLNTQKLVEILFRDELLSSNFLYLSRTVSDLNHNRTIECATLENVDNNKITVILSLTSGISCSKFHSEYLLDGAHVSQKLTALNGSKYKFTYRVVNSNLYYLATFLLRIGGSIAIILAFLLVESQKKNSRLKFESEKQISQAKVELARQVAHDIKSPLTSINFILSLFKNENSERMEVLKSALARVNEIANDLLSISESEENKFEDSNNKITLNDKEEIQTYKVFDEIESVVSEKRFLLQNQNKKLELINHLRHSDLFHTTLTAPVLKRIISNLLNNAIEAVDEKTGQIQVILDESPDSINITISDNGHGISKDIIPKLGKKGASFRKSGSIKRGTGLGLYNAKKNILNNGGDFSITSVEKAGTTIKFTILKYKL